ncbi:micrococcal nuclease [Symbiobacterium terraclitae]|uniref:Micrococcal nuclease n=1 Tax=Symbiobacterium terraclitae TaxID=557451 RepID=A0ABS4JWZ4_9FIRM|nr:thermonuclease family protein [Symbiobacterium terraclitae]MBP2020052.1 micrococcal nuclease [Symbiobacterium terraclitae]
MIVRRLVSLVVAAAVLAGCAGTAAPVSQAPPKSASLLPAVSQEPAPDVTRDEAAEEQPNRQVLEGCLAEAPLPPDDATKVRVTRAIDGDTLEFFDGTRVRLIGINTPESVDPRRPVQAYGKEASAYTKALTANQEVLYVPGQTPRDRYGRLLAWVWLTDGTFLNALLVRDGYAQVYTFADNPDHADLLLACQQEAREAGRGLWALPDYQDGQMAADMDREAITDAPRGVGEPEAAGDEPQSAAPEVIREPGVVSRGATAYVEVRTRPGDDCTISVIYKSGPSSAQGLQAKQANGAGIVSWSWKVGTRTTPGTWPVVITCGGQTVRTGVTVR